MSTVILILKALIAIPKIGKYIQKLVVVIVALMDQAKAKKIDEASFKQRKAKTKEERREVLKDWDNIFSG